MTLYGGGPNILYHPAPAPPKKPVAVTYPRPPVAVPKPSVPAPTVRPVTPVAGTGTWGHVLAIPEMQNVANQVSAQLDAAKPQQNNTADLMAQLLAMGNTGSSSKKKSSGRRRSGGGGGGGGGVAPQVHDAMLAYLSYLQSRGTDANKPFDDREARLNTAAAEGRSSIGDATNLLQQHITAAQAQARQQAQMRDAMLGTLQTQYGAASGDALQRALADLRAQGIGTGSLEAQNLSNQQGYALNQQQLGNAHATSDAALQQFLANQTATGQMAAAGGTQGLENTRLNLMAQIAEQRAAAQKAAEDQVQQFRLQMAQAGVTPP